MFYFVILRNTSINRLHLCLRLLYRLLHCCKPLRFLNSLSQYQVCLITYQKSTKVWPLERSDYQDGVRDGCQILKILFLSLCPAWTAGPFSCFMAQTTYICTSRVAGVLKQFTQHSATAWHRLWTVQPTVEDIFLCLRLQRTNDFLFLLRRVEIHLLTRSLSFLVRMMGDVTKKWAQIR